MAYPADRELDPADIRRISGGVGGRGGHRRKLQSVALKVLSQPISVGGVERVWSIFGWIQNKLRSKMLPATAKTSDGAHVAEDGRTMKKSGKWEADLLEHTDEDLTWEQLSDLLDEDED